MCWRARRAVRGLLGTVGVVFVLREACFAGWWVPARRAVPLARAVRLGERFQAPGAGGEATVSRPGILRPAACLQIARRCRWGEVKQAGTHAGRLCMLLKQCGRMSRPRFFIQAPAQSMWPKSRLERSRFPGCSMRTVWRSGLGEMRWEIRSPDQLRRDQPQRHDLVGAHRKVNFAPGDR